MNQASQAASAAMQKQLDGLRAGTKSNIGTVGRVTTHTLASGKTIGVPPHPTGDARSEASVLMSLSALHDLDSMAQQVRGNRMLSEQGQAAEIANKAAPHLKRIAAQWADVDAQEAEAQAREDQHYTPPPLKAGDAAAAVVDGQIRDRYARMKDSDKDKVLDSIRAGGAHDVAVALKRSPFPMIDNSEALNSAWRQHMDQVAPAIRGEIDGERESVRWARPVIKRVADMATGIAGLNKVQLWRALAPNGKGAAAFGLDPREVMTFQATDKRAGIESASANQQALDNARDTGFQPYKAA